MEDIFIALPDTLIIGSLAFFGFFGLLRISGKRTLSKWNAFDFVVTVAVGSVLATTIMPQPATLRQGAIALGSLVGWQSLLAWISLQVPIFRKLIEGQPRLLLWHGEFQEAALQAERITHDEIRAAIRAQGIAVVEQVGAVILETDGTFSVLPTVEETITPSAMDNVEGFEPAGEESAESETAREGLNPGQLNLEGELS